MKTHTKREELDAINELLRVVVVSEPLHYYITSFILVVCELGQTYCTAAAVDS